MDRNICKAALYMRLSKEDEKRGEAESQSIRNQRNLLREFAKKQGLRVIGEYVDDGYSGTNFDRPDFWRMLSDIEAGTINCVITKDFSRLGRNSARGLDYIDEWFPKHGVRYLSVIEGYDSFDLTAGAAMTAPMMLFMGEMYARDISGKIRASLTAKMHNGEYISAFAPYGYRKDETNKNHLVVDREAAAIVQKIFEMAVNGHAPQEIAAYLNDKGAATPAEYRRLKCPYPGADSTRRKWASGMVCKMLKNEVYLGCTVHGKTRKVSFKSKESVNNPRERWIRVDGTHEPLISEETYRLVQNRIVSRRRTVNQGFVNLFSGIARCADCGRNMSTAPSGKKDGRYNLCCGGYKNVGAEACSNHFIDYDLLYDTVFRELRAWVRCSEKENAEIQELTKPLLQTFIDRIEVEQGQYERDRSGKRIKRQKINICYKGDGKNIPNGTTHVHGVWV